METVPGAGHAQCQQHGIELGKRHVLSTLLKVIRADRHLPELGDWGLHLLHACVKFPASTLS